MNPLVLFYLMTSAIHVIPLVAITSSLQYGTALPFLPKKWFKHGLRNVGAARFDQLFQIFDSDLKNYLSKISLMASVIQLATVYFIIIAIECGVPLPFVPNIHHLLSPDTMIDLLIFSVTTSIIQLIPMFFLIIALVYRIPLPFLPSRPVRITPSITQITRWEHQSRGFASIRLTRFQNFEKTFFYAKCRDNRSGKIFKVALCQGTEEGAKTECYLYDEEGQTLEKIIPTPIGAKELEAMFSLDDD